MQHILFTTIVTLYIVSGVGNIAFVMKKIFYSPYYFTYRVWFLYNYRYSGWLLRTNLMNYHDVMEVYRRPMSIRYVPRIISWLTVFILLFGTTQIAYAKSSPCNVCSSTSVGRRLGSVCS